MVSTPSSPRGRRVSEQHQDLAAGVLEITDRVVTVGRHLEELRDLQARAIALAASSGVPQRVLAEIAGVSGPRISQIVRGQPVDIDPQRLRRDWVAWQQWPGDRLHELSGTPDDARRAAGLKAYVHNRDLGRAGARADGGAG